MAEREDAAEDRARDGEGQREKPRLTIRQLREAAQKETLAKELAKANQQSRKTRTTATAMPQRKKPSIFGGLFQVREPTQIALNQVAAQMIAQHGSTSATKVPNVRLEKMPEFVPKVNTKWDGIPESVKHREKKEKEKEKQQIKRGSFLYTETKSGSDDGRPQKNSRNSSSTTASSFGAHGNSSGSQGASSRTRFYAQSVNSSGDLASQQRTDDPQYSGAFGTQTTTESVPEKYSTSRRRRSSTGTDQNLGQRNDVELGPPHSSATNRSEPIRPKSTKSFGTDTSAPPKSSASNRSQGNQTQPVDKVLAWESIDWARAARSYGNAGVRICLCNHRLQPKAVEIRQQILRCRPNLSILGVPPMTCVCKPCYCRALMSCKCQWREKGNHKRNSMAPMLFWRGKLKS